MIRNVLAALSFLLVLGNSALAQTCTVPNTLTNGTNADATQVMANFTALLNCVNSVSAPAGYLNGLTLSTTGSSSSFGIGSGFATSDDATTPMKLSVPYTKTTGAWAVGSGNGSLDSGSIASNTWYHAFLIERIDTGVVDLVVSLSPTTPTLPANYAKKRRIGSMKTDGSAQWLKFKQIGPTFLWDVDAPDAVNASITGGSSILQPISTPPGIRTKAIMNVAYTAASISQALKVYSPDVSSPAQAFDWNVSFTQTIGGIVLGRVEEFTNTSAQVKIITSQSGNYSVNTSGWTDVSLALGL
jgi:hypothetical protein